MGKRKFKITEGSKTKAIKEDKHPMTEINKNIIVNFAYPFSLYSCNIKHKFTNYLPNEDSCYNLHQNLFSQVLKYFSEKNFDDLAIQCRGTHTHIISDSNKIELVKKVVKELIIQQINSKNNVSKEVENYIVDSDLWQLAYPNGLRLIGTRDANILNLLFIDYNHLIYASKDYNDKDFYKYKYNLMEINTAKEQVAATKNKK